MEGYPALACLQGQYPELGIYRRFSSLNARNLLYLQAELIDLETDLEKYTKEDGKSDKEKTKLCNKNWFYLSRKKDGVVGSQWHTMTALRVKLREYNECLVLQRQLMTFNQPERGNLKLLTRWLSDERHGNLAIQGLDRNVWKDGYDLLTVKPDSLDGDSFTRLLQKVLIDPFHRLRSSCRPPPDLENGIYTYVEVTTIRVANVIGTAISSILPVSAVVVLYIVRDMLKRLGIVALFTALFSLALMATTRAKRIEIFAATAAFASIQVVFIGSAPL
ncbi:hypothetical protein HYALB_00007536 [Hymenoscyphus albidus]|uniref:DUF6594 domain-containing protein n=1 Tax=Hymenoscyphus albidus TaxID=595503 RepID=A0A9N9LIV9_9HELO|nr:hypothetical protein HYALB_00007536 [Hymenoscyphus albidus]